MDPHDLHATLSRHRPDFLRYLERRVKDRSTAEDLLQEALLKGVTGAAALRDEAALLGWFYRVLENAALDHHRRSATAHRALDQVQQEMGDAYHTVEDAPSRTCQCVTRLKEELKPEYADALDRMTVDEVAVMDYADQTGISRSNAAVRAYRAREALRKKVEITCGHCAAAGCTDCSCVQ